MPDGDTHTICKFDCTVATTCHAIYVQNTYRASVANLLE